MPHPNPSDTIRLKSSLSHRYFEPAVSPTGGPSPIPTRPRSSVPTATAGRIHWHEGAEYGTVAHRPGVGTRAAVRTFDLIVATIALAVFAPIMMLVAIAVKIDTRGPLIYGSPRIGQRSDMFTAWKFRSMHPDAELRLAEILKSDPRAEEEYRLYHKLRDDPRLTTVGAFIRRTSLDELPQLFNILVGQMSVVGPRPNLLSERAMFGARLNTVLQVKPGLTGLWQISGRNRLPVSERVALDLQYVRSRTVAADVRICVKTFVQLWRPGKHGGY